MGKKGSLAIPGWESSAGEKNRQSKLTNDQIRIIRNEVGKLEELAMKYGVTAAYIQRIKKGTVRKIVS